MNIYEKEKIDELIAAINTDISNLQEDLANYIDSFASKAALDAYSGDLSNNDWAVVLDDETHSHQCWRYVYNAASTEWRAQFKINEEPMTQAQMDALNSGITAAKVAAFEAKQNQLTAGNGAVIANDVVSVKPGSGIKVDSDGVSATNISYLSLSQYNALTPAQQNDGTTYNIYDDGTIRQNGNIIANKGPIVVNSISSIVASASTIGNIYYAQDDNSYYVTITIINEGITTYSWKTLSNEDSIPKINNGTIDNSGVVSIGTKISNFKGIIVAPENTDPTSIPLGYSLETYESV